MADSEKKQLTNVDREVYIEYSSLITYLENLIHDLAAISAHRKFGAVTIKEVGAILTKVETLWDDSRSNYGEKWPYGTEQFANLVAGKVYEKWKTEQISEGCIFPNIKIRTLEYESDNLSVEETNALQAYEGQLRALKDEIKNIAQKADYGDVDDFSIRLIGRGIKEYTGGWKRALKMFGKRRNADAFRTGYKWAISCYENYMKFASLYEEDGMDVDTDLDSDS
ncbi:hypothetical protein RUND412_005832 [Rhizina undulata]